MRVNKFEIASYLLIIVINLIGIALFYGNVDFFLNSYIIEDGIVEYLTAVFLLITALVSIYRLFNLKGKSFLLYTTCLLIFVLFVFGAGEEISWGQRIFGWETSAEFGKLNAQNETNFHNMIVGGKKINELIFSGLMYACLSFFLIAVPLIYSKFKSISTFFDRSGVPIPKLHHGIMFLIALGFVSLIQHGKQWELMECSFAIILFMVVYQPLNRKTLIS